MDVIEEAFNNLPQEVKAKLLFNGSNYLDGAKVVAPHKTKGTVVQFLTHLGKDENGFDVEKGVVWMGEGCAILPHKHETDSECYQEVTKSGFILNGEPTRFAVCRPGEEHYAEAAPRGGSCIAWEWHEDGKNLNFTPQDFPLPSKEGNRDKVRVR